MNAVPDILKRILADKADEVLERSRRRPLAQLRAELDSAPKPRGFLRALRRQVKHHRPAVIAEIKQASPSKGVLRAELDVAAIAASYAGHGATCLSVLTDAKYFQGQAGYLGLAHAACKLPLLRKDFMIDRWQIYESRVLGADCILLIVAALDDLVIAELLALAKELGMDALVEVHDAPELERARALDAPLIGINNRDLRSFTVDVHTTLALRAQVPGDRLLVTESGITGRDDVSRLCAGGVSAFLVGEVCMRAPDPGVQLAELFDGQRLA
ncbi:MAG: indole-3-glycerol phosphate synthase TrpC [Gammaproteobacteria bacterium]